MAEKVKYEFILVGDTYPEDASEFESVWENEYQYLEYIASDAAESYYTDDPDPDAFPLDIEIFTEGESLGEFRVSLEFDPSFSATGI